MSMFLVVCMMASMFAGLTFATVAEGATAASVTVGGVVLDAEHPYLLETTAVDNFTMMASDANTAEGYSLHATFDADSGTLTFNRGMNFGGHPNASGNEVRQGFAYNSSIFYAKDEADDVKYGIKAEGDLVIDIGINQRTANLFESLGHVDFGNSALTFEDFERPL